MFNRVFGFIFMLFETNFNFLLVETNFVFMLFAYMLFGTESIISSEQSVQVEKSVFVAMQPKKGFPKQPVHSFTNYEELCS